MSGRLLGWPDTSGSPPTQPAYSLTACSYCRRRHVSGESPESLSWEARGQKVSVVDAVCCVYFCAAGKSGLLIAILTGLGMEVLIPEEVVAEAETKRSYGQLATHLGRLKASTTVKILPRLVREDERTAVLANVARVRGMSLGLSLSSRRDLGEAVVIGHA